MPQSFTDALCTIRSLGIQPGRTAALLDVRRQQIYRWEAGEAPRDLDKVERIHALSAAIEALREAYGGDDDRVMGWFMRHHPDIDKSPWRWLEVGKFDGVLKLARKDAAAVLGVTA